MMLFFCFFSGLAEEPARKTLRWMGHWENRGLREQLVLETREEFQFLHQDVDVKLAFPGEIMPLSSKQLTGQYIALMIQSGKIDWDVVWMDPQIYRKVAIELNDPEWGKKHLVDFSQFPDIKAAHQPFLVEGPDCHEETGGVFVGPYIEGVYTHIWYNKVAAEKAGLDIKEIGMSADDFLGYLSRIKEYNQTAEKPISGFAWPTSLYRLAYNLYLSEHLPHPDTPDQKILTQILRFFEAIHPFRSLIKTDWSLPWKDYGQALMNDEMLFMVDASWRYTSLNAAYPDLMKKLRPAQLPGFEDQSFYVGGYIPTWAVMKNSPSRDLGIELMRFWCSPEVAQKWIRYTKCPTGLSGNFYDSEYGLDVFPIFQKKLISGRTPQMDVMLLGKEKSPIFAIWDYILPVLNGEMTTDEVLMEMKGQANE
jgi:ABC-type glycerol-3-phosphate transport system substrate-binding protein